VTLAPFRRAGLRSPSSSMAGGAAVLHNVVRLIVVGTHLVADVAERPLADRAQSCDAGPLQDAGKTETVPTPTYRGLVVHGVQADWAY